MSLYVGTSGFAYRAWKGAFYPKDLPANQMLRCYGVQFRTVEMNDTFRRLPEPSVLQARADDVPAGFQFALKAPQQITHFKRLKDVDDLVSQLFKIAATLKKCLGPVPFQ